MKVGQKPKMSNICLSTHGGAGWPPGSYQREDGKIVCGACGEAFPSTAYTPSWVKKGISFEEEEQRKREEYLQSRNLIERFLDFLFRS